MSDIKTFLKRAELRIFLVYSLAHLPIFLLSDARYWDDWSISGASRDMLVSVFTQAGFPLLGYYHYLIQLVGWWLYAFSTFALGYLILHLFYHSLKGLNATNDDALALSVVAAVLPLYWARIAAINNPGSFFVLIFVFALYLFISAVKDKNPIKEFCAYAFFIFSFQFNALVAFFLAVLFIAIYLFYKELENSAGRINRMNYFAYFKYITKKTLAIVLLPFFYAIIQHFFFQRSGMFAGGYNNIDLNAAALFIGVKVVLLYLFPYDGLYAGKELLALTFAAVALTVYWMKRRPANALPEPRQNGPWLVGIGAALLGFGTLAYVLVGKEPVFEPWTATRFQELLPFGAAFSTLGLFKILCALLPSTNPDARRRMTAAAFAGLIGIFTVNWWFVYATFYIDHLQQEAVIDTIKTTPSLQNRNYSILDRSGLAAFDTVAGLGEYAGLHEAATGRHNALILDYDSLANYGGWSAFVANFGKFLGAWSKVEDAKFDVPGCVYIVNRGRAGQDKWAYAMHALINKLWHTDRYQARQLLSFDGPYCHSS